MDETVRSMLPGLGLVESSEPLSPSRFKDEPDWALIERITGKKCPEEVNLSSLSKMTPEELARTLKLTESQTKRLGSALVLGQRLAERALRKGVPIKSGEDVFLSFRGRLREETREGFYAVTLNQKHRIIDMHQISQGTLTMCPVHPREAFRPVIQDAAAAVIFLHNHPSGDPEPSPDDHSLTGRLVEIGHLLGIRVLDHLVVGNESFVSFRDIGFNFDKTASPGVSNSAEAEYVGRVEEEDSSFSPK